MRKNWHNIITLSSRNYTCGYCGNSLASEKGYYCQAPRNPKIIGYLYICHFCSNPTFFDLETEKQTPGASFGGDVLNIDDNGVENLYNEARQSFAASSFTSVVLSCRKLLMHVAVSKGAQTGLNFIEYVEYLSSNNYIPPDAKDWVDHIRSKGNEANHEIVIMQEQDAKDLLAFSEMLLKLVYEFPGNIKKKKAV